jgi:hypothetical protein
VDLLSLQGTPADRLYEILAAREIPGVAYHALRLFIRAPEIVLTSGEVIDASMIDLVGSGSVDITFAEPLLLEADEDRVLVLDFDVKHSIFPPDAGSQGLWTVRPLVLADALEDGAEIATPLDVRGEVSGVAVDDGELTMSLSATRGSITVRRSEAEVVDAYGPHGGDVAIGSFAAVRGWLTSDGEIDADIVALGDVRALRGVLSETSQSGLARVTLESGEEVTVEITENAVVSVGRLVQTKAAALPGGGQVSLTGWTSVQGSAPADFRAVVVDVVPAVRRGRVVGLTRGGDGVQVEVSHGEATSALRSRTPMLEDQAVYYSGGERFAAGDLVTGNAVTIRRFGDEASTTVRLEPSTVQGVVRGIDLTEQTFLLDGRDRTYTIHVAVDARIVQLEATDNALWQRPMVFGDITEGMRVEAVGHADEGLTTYLLMVTPVEGFGGSR